MERDGHPVAEQPRRLAEAGVRDEQRQHQGRGLLRALLLQRLCEQLRRQDGVDVSLLARLADGILARGPALLATATFAATATHLVGAVLAAAAVLLAAAAALGRSLPLCGGEAHLPDIEAALLQRGRRGSASALLLALAHPAWTCFVAKGSWLRT
jgi:hypothetical protein